MEFRTLEIDVMQLYRVLNDVFVGKALMNEDPILGSVCIDLTLMGNSPYSENLNVVLSSYGEDTSGIEIPMDIEEIVFGRYEEDRILRVFDRIDCPINKKEFFEILKELCRRASEESATVYRDNTDNFIEEIETILKEQENSENFCVIGLEVGDGFSSIKVEICQSTLVKTKILSCTTLYLHDDSDVELEIERESEAEEG